MAGRSLSALGVTCAAAALALAIPAAAVAGPPDQSGVVEREPVWSAPLFWDGELIVLVGPPALEQGCVGEGFHYPVATLVTTPGGSTITRYTDTDSVLVFDDENVDDPIDWLGRACSAVWASEQPPSPWPVEKAG